MACMGRGSTADCGPPDSALAWHGMHETAWEEWRSGVVRLGKRMIAGIQEFGCWNSGIRVNIQEFKQNSEMASLSRGTK